MEVVFLKPCLLSLAIALLFLSISSAQSTVRMQVQHEQEDKEEGHASGSSRSAQPAVSFQPLATGASVEASARPPVHTAALKGHDGCSGEKRTAPMMKQRNSSNGKKPKTG
jgi:hypothetical protein